MLDFIFDPELDCAVLTKRRSVSEPRSLHRRCLGNLKLFYTDHEPSPDMRRHSSSVVRKKLLALDGRDSEALGKTNVILQDSTATYPVNIRPTPDRHSLKTSTLSLSSSLDIPDEASLQYATSV